MNAEDAKGLDRIPNKKPFVKPTATLIRFDSTEEANSFPNCKMCPPCIGAAGKAHSQDIITNRRRNDEA